MIEMKGKKTLWSLIDKNNLFTKKIKELKKRWTVE